jgi:transcriptional regulator with XRE-family HTH domain
LREAREAVGLSRPELARRSGVASATIKAYELGLRHPSRQLLTALLDGIDCDRLVRNEVLEGAGFRADGLDIWRQHADFALGLEEAIAEIQESPWPAIVTGEGMKLLGSNKAYDRLWGGGGGGARLAGGFLAWMSYPPFADRLKNWTEVMRFLIGEMKGSVRFPEHAPEGTSAPMQAAIERLLSGDASYIDKYLSLWETTPPTRAKARFSYRIVFDHEALGVLSFRCIGVGVNEMDGLVVNDWIPTDAVTWERLGGGEGSPTG